MTREDESEWEEFAEAARAIRNKTATVEQIKLWVNSRFRANTDGLMELAVQILLDMVEQHENKTPPK